MPSMSEWETIDDGSWNGVKKYIRADDDMNVQVRYEGFDVTPILEQNKSDYNPRGAKSEFWHIGHIPASVGLKWLVETGLDMWNPDHSDDLAKRLMDSDYRYLVPGQNRIIL
jgi:hypothetical protein